ncbi:MAG: 3-oxoacyl-[acyl-carrier-protein] reductase [Candidatus Cloacimonetes bacterium]|jgi:3-oxoacyl-[acyl-carrier protein] reductase|nr:3-oxoacyl-[acyl-carrier-protein] reductase [Candidatus Cloacimonadota bacterium]MDD4155971.1 3-oxoacyl-[acyl-carrier-protein] reductase [Candidatus Cloacimonadota bacterium]
MKRLENKVAVITGSARGIGFSIAERFAEEGATVIIADLNQEIIDTAVNNLLKKSYKAAGCIMNVTDAKNVEDCFKSISKEYGSIDILVNNAGITKDNLIMRMKESDWDAVINVNLKGTFICTQKVSRIMLNQKYGSIINMASVIGIMGNLGQANYAASKGGVIALTKSTAKEFASRNIRCNAVAPGFIETEMTATLDEKIIEEYAKAIPLKRMGKTLDVANLCLFLASDEACYITGQTLNVDGGLIM